VSLLRSEPDHYTALGLDRQCTVTQIRAAYRLLAKHHHPDVNHAASDAMARTQEINAAHDVLSDPERRQAYVLELTARDKRAVPARSGRTERNVSHDVQLRIEEFLRGTSLEVRLNDPANPNGPETYQLSVPPATAPGTRFRLPRTSSFEGGFVLVRVRARPDFRFKVRASDLRCDLRINSQRAAQGGSETVVGPDGARLHVQIPRGIARGQIIRLLGEGLPKPRGSRGDLLVRVTYRPEIRVVRAAQW